MSTRIVDEVGSWESRSFAGGYGELQQLADSEFSGVVRAGGAELYMTRGVAVGIRRGDIEDFESSGTTYEAPTDALPLLAIMQERSDEVRAKYYTEDTSISKVDQTLSDGGFTGYIELSENVLSGDYYLVYHAGKSMSVGYVGESSRLIEGDEAFETADDEVGIYKVRPVDIEPVEIPEPENPPAGGETDEASADDPDETEDEPAGASETGADSGDATTGTEPRTEEKASTEEVESPPANGSAGQASAETTETGSSQQDTEREHTEQTESREPADARTETEVSQANDRENASPAGSDASSQQSRRDGTESAGAEQSAPNSSEQNPQKQRRDSEQKSQTQGQTSAEQSATSQRADTTDRTEQSRSEKRTNPGPAEAGAGQPGRQRGTDSGHQSRRPQSPREPTRSQPRQSEQPRQSGGQATSRTESPAQETETKAIPSLDPDRTTIPDDAGSSNGAVPQPEPTPRTESRQEPKDRGKPSVRDQEPRPRNSPQSGQEPQPQSAERTDQTASASKSQPEPTQGSPSAAQRGQQASPQENRQDESPPEQSPAEPQEPAVDPGRLDELESEVEEKDNEIDRLETELANTEEERNELREEVESLRAERDDLEDELAQLEDELTRLEDELGAATNAERRLTADEALAGTDIFVRYRSKGKATLDKAHNSSTRKDDVNENLRLEKHTQFDAANAAVGGKSYEEFLESTLEFQFVRWIVRELLFEIRDTGHEKALADLYDVLPQIDRAELSAVVDVTYTEDGQETQSQEAFDVVLRDRMGNPLLAANLNDTREATTEGMMEQLITSAERVGQSADGFSGAFLVTESFFDPGALEVASDATKGGLLSRDKRKSFVNISRKSGYHLCLVEARNENFHLAVPEL